MFEVKTEQFSGPMDKLLELIETRKMEITALNLAAVTGDFLIHLEKIGSSLEPSALADFLVVASKLVLIKSKTLLPNLELTQDEEKEVHDLEARLKIYKEFAANRKTADNQQPSAAGYLEQLWDKSAAAYARPLMMSFDKISVFYPGTNLTAERLADAVTKLTAELIQLVPEQKKIKTFIISLEEKMKELVSRCQEAIKNSFKGLTQNRPRSEIIVLFLAILHLLRTKSIDVEQSGQFGDIIFKSSNADALPEKADNDQS